MHDFSLAHLSDDSLLRDLSLLVIKERRDTAWILAHIAEVDARKLYVPAGYSSMHVYCVEELHFSDDAAYRRIRAARAAREFPQLFDAVADGRLHLAGVCLLVPYLTSANVEELIGCATHRRKQDIEEILAQRNSFSRPVDSLLQLSQLVPGPVGHTMTSTEVDEKRAPEPPAIALTPPAVVRTSPPDYLVQISVSPSTRDKIRYAQALLSHSLPSGDISRVLERALDLLIAKVQTQKFGAGKATATQRRRLTVGGRYIPAEVRNAVWRRDKGQCTFEGANGKRCTARHFLEFDHVTPLARGGSSTIEGLRLRCRAHNQFEAERVFGVEFMKKKRQRR